MKTLSWWAIVSGLVIGTLTFAVIPYLEWQTAKTLREFDGEKHLPTMMKLIEDDFRFPLAQTRGHSCLSVLAGVLMLKRRRVGWLLWAALCAFPIAGTLYDAARWGTITAASFRAVWWSLVLWVSWVTVRQKAQSYWVAGSLRTADQTNRPGL